MEAGGHLVEIRHGATEERLPWDEFESRVRAGRIPPETEVRFAPLTGDRFLRAEELDLWRTLHLEAASAGVGSGPPPVLTALLLGVQIRVWWLSRLDGGIIATALFSNSAALVFEDRQIWRPLSMGLVHVELGHILANGLWFAYLGWILERTLGRANLALLFFASVLGGSVLSAALSPFTTSIGASGGVFGMLAAFGVVRLVRPELFDARYGGWVGLLLVLAFPVWAFWSGLHAQGVDNWAHFGGLCTGIVLGFFLDPPGSERRKDWNNGVRLVVVTVSALVLAVLAIGGPRIQPLVDEQVATDTIRRRERPRPQVEPPPPTEPPPPRPLRFDVPSGWLPAVNLVGAPAFVSPVGSGHLRAWSVASRTEERNVSADDVLAEWIAEVRRTHPDAEIGDAAAAELAGRAAAMARATFPGAPDEVLEWYVTTRGSWVLEAGWQVDARRVERLRPLRDRLLASIVWDEPPELVEARNRVASGTRDEGAHLQLVEQAARAGDRDVALQECARIVADRPGDRKGWRTCLEALSALRVGGDELDDWLTRALAAPAEARTIPAVADALAADGRVDLARGLLEIAWIASPGDAELKKARRRLGMPTALDEGAPWERARDPITGEPRPADERERWTPLASTLTDAEQAGAWLAADRQRAIAFAVAAIGAGDPGGRSALLGLREGWLPPANTDAVAALAGELADAAAGTPPEWMPSEIAAALAAHPDYSEVVRGSVPAGG